MTLTSKGQATRARIIEGAAAYLRRGDAGSATLDDIRAVTSTSKSQLFHYFPGGKEELLLAVAQHEAGRVLTDQEPYLSRLDSWASWQAWREAVVARYRAQGASCPLGALMDQVRRTPGAPEVVTTLLAQWQEQLRAGIVAMQAGGEVAPGIDAERTSAALIAAIQGGVAVLRSTGSTAHLEAAIDLVVDHLKTAR